MSTRLQTFIDLRTYCESDNPEDYHHSQVTGAKCKWCSGRNPNYQSTTAKAETSETSSYVQIDLTVDTPPQKPTSQLSLPDTLKNAPKPTKSLNKAMKIL